MRLPEKGKSPIADWVTSCVCYFSSRRVLTVQEFCVTSPPTQKTGAKSIPQWFGKRLCGGPHLSVTLFPLTPPLPLSSILADTVDEIGYRESGCRRGTPAVETKWRMEEYRRAENEILKYALFSSILYIYIYAFENFTEIYIRITVPSAQLEDAPQRQHT